MCTSKTIDAAGGYKGSKCASHTLGGHTLTSLLSLVGRPSKGTEELQLKAQGRDKLLLIPGRTVCDCCILKGPQLCLGGYSFLVYQDPALPFPDSGGQWKGGVRELGKARLFS